MNETNAPSVSDEIDPLMLTPIRRIVEGLSQYGSGDYFAALVTELTAALPVDYAFAAQIVSENPIRARTVAVARGADILPNFEYGIDGTPCSLVLQRKFCAFPKGARQCFPTDTLFLKWNIEGYAAVGLHDSSDALIGWLAVMSEEPIRDDGLLRSALLFLAARTSAELRDRARAGAHTPPRVRALHDEAFYDECATPGDRYEMAARASRFGIWDLDTASDRLYVCARTKAILRWEQKTHHSTFDAWIAAIDGRDRDRVHSELRALGTRGGDEERWESEHRILTSDGAVRWVLCRGIAAGNDRIAGTIEDTTDQKLLEEQLRHDALHDTLTRLPNRTLFLDRLEHLLTIRHSRPGSSLAVLFLDLDRFKVVNDSLGHLAGDELLRQVGQRLRSELRPADTVARLGGDEFSLLLEEVDSPEEVVALATRIEQAIARPFRVGGEEVFTGVSIGIAMGSGDYVSAEELLRDADTAMYMAKESGRGRHEIFDSTMHTAAVERMELEMDLRRAIENEEFILVYQPVISTRTGRVTGFEALLRWNHPRRGIVTPNQFIPIAEETGMIIPIGLWVIQRVCRRLREWDGESDAPLSMSVNVSLRQLLAPGFNDSVASALAEESITPGRLRLELTESAMVSSSTTAAERLRTLRDLGVEVWIDDFGTGYSSLSYLLDLPIDALKIDRSFISEIGSRQDSVDLVRAIVDLAHRIGLHVVAEGVESEEQFREVLRCGCDYVQGFFLGRPLSETAADALIREE
jgi:diguanylate cyclase (GGDEF)-like protein